MATRRTPLTRAERRTGTPLRQPARRAGASTRTGGTETWTRSGSVLRTQITQITQMAQMAQMQVAAGGLVQCPPMSHLARALLWVTLCGLTSSACQNAEPPTGEAVKAAAPPIQSPKD